MMGSMKTSYSRYGLSLLAWTIRAVLLGLVIGPVITLLNLLIQTATQIRGAHPFLILCIPLGALATTFLYQKIGPYLKEGGSLMFDLINEGIMDIAHPTTIAYEGDRATQSGRLSTKMAPLLLANTFITHLVGASGGKEGVGVQLGASLGSYLYRLEYVLFKERKLAQQTGIWLISGAGAAFGALFNAPIAGTMFGMQFSNPRVNRTEALLPCLVSSYTACLVSQALGIHTLQPVVALPMTLDLKNLFVLALLGILFGFLGRLFCHLTHLTKSALNKITTNIYLRPLVSSAILLALSLVVYALYGSFEHNGLSLNLIINAGKSITNPLTPLYKLLLTMFTIGSGFVGGEFVPIMVIGSAFAVQLAGYLAIPASTMAMFGALGMLSGCTKLPLACFMLGLELFGYYANPIALFLVCCFAYLASGRRSIYEHQIVPEIMDDSFNM